jgi:hypothetical protein
MKVVRIIFFVLLGIVGILVIGGFFLPRNVTVSRNRVIKAPREVVYAQVAELRNWEKWSPWHNLDPDMRLTYSSTSSGPGAWYSWTSENQNVGNGKFTIISSTPDSLFAKMQFGSEAETSSATHRFQVVPEGTLVTWSMHSDMGPNPLFRWVGLLLDGFVGKDYEKGLQNLANITEAKPGITTNP